MEMLRELGFCSGIENYSRILDGRQPGDRPTACSTTSRRTSSASSTSPTRRCRRSAACTRATARASRRSSTTASGCRARWTTGRRPSRSSCRSRRSSCSSRRRPASTSATHSGRIVEQIVPPDGNRRPRPVEVRETRNQIDDLMNEIRDRVDRERARARDDADQEDGRGPDRLPARDGLPRALPALGGRHARADPDHPRAAPRRVRRARRRQPAARGPRPPGGVARRDPRRRQGGLPARRDVADPDDRPRGAQHRRHGR